MQSLLGSVRIEIRPKILLVQEGKQAVKMTRLSCHHFRSNQVRLALSLLAYNLGNLWRRLGLPRGIENWSLTSLQQRLVKTGGRLVKHARYYWLLLAEGHLTRRRFGAMLGRIALLAGAARIGECWSSSLWETVHGRGKWRGVGKSSLEWGGLCCLVAEMQTKH